MTARGTSRDLLLLLSACAWTVSAARTDAGEIRGRVLVDGKAKTGVTVSALPFEDGFAVARREARRADLPKALAVATSRPDGAFTVAVPAAAGGAVHLAFSGGSAAPRVLEAIVDSGGGDVGDVRLPKATALAGRVVDESGNSVVAATVTVWAGGGRPLDVSPGQGVPQTTTTNADGNFRFEAAGGEANRLPQPSGRLRRPDGRVYMWSVFTGDGTLRLTGPVRRIENVAPGRYTFEAGAVHREVTVTEGGHSLVVLP